MAQGPSLLFDKSTLESLSVNEAVLLDNFYRATITPLFFVECLADLEREMVRMRGTPEQLVGSLAERTPDSQSVMNVHHMNILKGELSGQVYMDTVLLRPMVAGGKRVELGDSKGVLFQESEEEEALQRWARYDFLGVERQFAKRWRKMIEQIDIQAMSRSVCAAIGPWRTPKSLEDARAMTDVIIDNLDPEWLLRFGLELLGVPEGTEYVIGQWKAGRRKPLRTCLPYFIHMLSINIFFALVMPTQLLKNVKASHQIDLAYLYYLPFCAVFSSRDNFHVQVAPLFLQAAQQFVHGDDLKADLKKLDELYKKLPPGTLEKGLYSFAPVPPDDDTYLTTRLWDAYLPYWRKDSGHRTEVPEQIKKALKAMLEKARSAAPLQNEALVESDEVGFAEMSRQIKPVKGDYFRVAKEILLQNQEKEPEAKVQVRPPGTAFSSLVESLGRLFEDSKCSNIEVFFLSNKLDEQGKKVVHEKMHVAEIHQFAIHVFNDQTCQALKCEYDKAPVLGILTLWTRYGTGKLGIQKLRPVSKVDSSEDPGDYEEWEAKAITAYLDRHNL